MTFEGEGIFVGLVCLVLAALVAVRIVRGVRTGSLPLYRNTIERSGNESRFVGLLIVQVILLFLMAFIAADLLLGLGFRD